MYRDLKLRAAIINDKQLSVLPAESIFKTYRGVWNLSAEQGNLGLFVVTNVRIVWYAQLTENFNVSVPWVHVKRIHVKESKYGIALVIETSEFSGSYVLGFRVENIDEIFKELASLFDSYRKKPMFGVQCRFDEEGETDIKKLTIPHFEDKENIVQTDYEHVRSIQNTYAIHKKKKQYAKDAKGQESVDSGLEDEDIEYNEDLGVACEKLPSGVTIENLWKIA